MRCDQVISPEMSFFCGREGTALVFAAACGLSLVVASRGSPLAVVRGLLLEVASLAVAHGL